MRHSFETVWHAVALAVAQRVTCPRLQVGAVVVGPDNQIISTGYNGAPRGEPHCIDVGCEIEANHCIRVVHAEVNALLQAGPRAKGATLYCTHKPCARCTAIIKNAGIVRALYLQEY